MSDSILYKNIGTELNLGSLNSIETIQTLWSGYGQLVRLRFEKNSIIVKHIKLPKTSSHPQGWNTNLSHKRKLKSYKVEVNWYGNFSKQKDKRCIIPQGLKTFQTKNEWLIVMEDLATLGFNTTTLEASKQQIISALTWLANFHAKYLNTKSEVVWEIGTYWHLDTRPDELEVLDDIELKKYAKKIDEVLNNSKYKTIVHGDAKLANFCFTVDGKSCAAVDFQYVGHGCAMKDVVYFMSSAIPPQDCEKMQPWLLDTYFKALNEAIKYYKPNINTTDLEDEYRALFEISWADFQRFVKGWNPNHFKINSYTENLTKKAIKLLS